MPVKPSRSSQQYSKRLDQIKNDFERGIFLALYNSKQQRWNRFFATVTLSIKHCLRGFLFSWPLYMLAFAAYSLPGSASLIFIILLVPAVYVSWMILSRGIKEDYSVLIEGYILRSGFIGRLLFNGKV